MKCIDRQRFFFYSIFINSSSIIKDKSDYKNIFLQHSTSHVHPNVPFVFQI